MSKSSLRFALLAASALLAAGCQQGDGGNNSADANTSAGGQQAGGTISQSLAQSPDHSNFVAAIKAAGLDGTMGGSESYTVFAPTNAAFQKLPAGAAETLMQPDQKGQLTSILTAHISPGLVTAEDLTKAIERGGGKAQIATVSGGTLTATQSGGSIVISDGAGGQARVTQSGQPLSNGIVHSLDTILMPAPGGTAEGQPADAQ